MNLINLFRILISITHPHPTIFHLPSNRELLFPPIRGLKLTGGKFSSKTIVRNGEYFNLENNKEGCALKDRSLIKTQIFEDIADLYAYLILIKTINDRRSRYNYDRNPSIIRTNYERNS